MESIDGGMDFVFSRDSILALARVLCFGPADVAQLTQGFIFSGSLNGSLWTLKIEVLRFDLSCLSIGREPVDWCPLRLRLLPIERGTWRSTLRCACEGQIRCGIWLSPRAGKGHPP